jgi:ATP-dependent Clp protease adaptor protein ClpS
MKTVFAAQHQYNTETTVCEEELTSLLSENQLILYNDDFNSFDTVIESLIKVCKHDKLQAEQCSHLVHYKGRCSVKKGAYHILEPMCTALLERGLTAEIE